MERRTEERQLDLLLGSVGLLDIADVDARGGDLVLEAAVPGHRENLLVRRPTPADAPPTANRSHVSEDVLVTGSLYMQHITKESPPSTWTRAVDLHMI